MTTTTTQNTTQQAGYMPPLFGKSGAEILSTKYPDPVFILPEICPTGLTILSGRPKLGKSFLALQAAQAKSAGGMLFGKPTQQGRVLYIALEDNDQRLQERMKKQGWTNKSAKNTTFFTAYDFRQNVGPLHKTGHRFLEMLIQAEDYKLIVIDTLSRAFMGLRDINDSQDVTAALSPLQELAILHDVGLLFIDHQAKPKGNNPNPIDDIFGSTAKAAVLDTAIGVYRDPQSKTLRLLAEGRAIPPVDITLKFDPITGCWQSEGDSDQFINTQNEKEVVDALMALKTSSLTGISQYIGKNKGNTSKVLTKLVNRGIVERIGSGTTVIFRYIGN